MKCPNCGSEAADDALTCDLCQFVLRRESAAPPPPPPPPVRTPGEPGKLDSPEAVQELMKTALRAAKAGLLPEARRLVSRLFLETTLADCRTFIVMGGDTWLASVPLPPERAREAKGLIAQAGDLVLRERFAEALPLLHKAQGMAADAPGQNMLFPMLILGLKGAADSVRNQAPADGAFSFSSAPAAPAAQAPAAPRTLDSAAAIDALLLQALPALRAGRADEVERVVARLFLEVDLAYCADKVREAGVRWIESADLSPTQAIVASRMIAEGADRVAKEQFVEAAPWLEQALASGKDAADQDWVFPMLLAGLRGAIEDVKRMTRYKSLVDAGVKAMATTGGKAEAAACFEQALALLPASPRTDGERKVRERLEALLKTVRG